MLMLLLQERLVTLEVLAVEQNPLVWVSTTQLVKY